MKDKIQNIEQQKDEINRIGLNAIKEYFSVDLSNLNKEALKHLHSRARIGLSFEKEMSVSKRAVEMNYIRIFRMIAEDKKELKKYIKTSMPKYYPIK